MWERTGLITKFLLDICDIKMESTLYHVLHFYSSGNLKCEWLLVSRFHVYTNRLLIANANANKGNIDEPNLIKYRS